MHQPKWFRAKQIAEAVNVCTTSVNRCLGRMRKYAEVNEMSKKVRYKNNITRQISFYSFKK